MIGGEMPEPRRPSVGPAFARGHVDGYNARRADEHVVGRTELLDEARQESPEFADEVLHEALVWLGERGYRVHRVPEVART